MGEKQMGLILAQTTLSMPGHCAETGNKPALLDIVAKIQFVFG